MMRLGISAISTTSLFSLSCTNVKATIGRRNITTDVAQNTLASYSNIFTQVGDGVLIHANLPSGKTPEKRMTFVKLHMQANYLIGNNNVSLSDLTRLCNANGYRPMKKGGQKGKKLNSSDLVKSLLSKSNKGLFTFSKDEDNKAHVSLTDRGIQASQQVASSLNSVSAEEPKGRIKNVLITFIKEGWLKENLPISIKKLLKGCTNHGYNPMSSDLKKCIASDKSKQLFVFDKDRDSVKLSPVGLKVAQSLQKDTEKTVPFH